MTWRSSSDPSNVERDRADATGTGRYRLDTTAGDLSLKVADRDSFGSLPPWSGEVRCPPDRETLVLVTLPRGAAATITRPEGWSGEWFLQSSFRPRGAESWETYVGWSTAESSSTLTVLRSGEWRFELRQDSALEANPLVRTAFLKDGETTLVER